MTTDNFKYLLDRLDYTVYPQRAYDKVEDIVHFALQSDSTKKAIQQYLDRPTAKWREVVLDCVADLEMELTFFPLRKSILQLLQSNKKELARSAALALLFGGKQARIELFESVKSIPHKNSVMRLIEFIQQGYKKI